MACLSNASAWACLFMEWNQVTVLLALKVNGAGAAYAAGSPGRYGALHVPSNNETAACGQESLNGWPGRGDAL